MAFSPTGRAWAAATTEGLQIYSLDETIIFNPFELDIDVTPENIKKTLHKQEYLKALVVMIFIIVYLCQMSFNLNEMHLIRHAFNVVPPNEIQLVVQGFPPQYISKLLSFIATEITESPNLELHLLWILKIFNQHGKFLKDSTNLFAGIFRNLQKNVTKQHQELANVYALMHFYYLGVKRMFTHSDTLQLLQHL